MGLRTHILIGCSIVAHAQPLRVTGFHFGAISSRLSSSPTPKCRSVLYLGSSTPATLWFLSSARASYAVPCLRYLVIFDSRLLVVFGLQECFTPILSSSSGESSTPVSFSSLSSQMCEHLRPAFSSCSWGIVDSRFLLVVVLSSVQAFYALPSLHPVSWESSTPTYFWSVSPQVQGPAFSSCIWESSLRPCFAPYLLSFVRSYASYS